MLSFVNDLYDYDYTGEQRENNEKESDKEIYIKLKGEGNTINENNENFIEIGYPFLIQIVLDLKKKKMFAINKIRQ